MIDLASQITSAKLVLLLDKTKLFGLLMLAMLHDAQKKAHSIAYNRFIPQNGQLLPMGNIALDGDCVAFSAAEIRKYNEIFSRRLL